MAVTTSQVQQLYIAYFNRPADFFGLTFQTAQANQFGLQFVADQFSKSPEYISTYAGKGIGEIVDTIYMNLFGRHAEPAGLKFWGDLLSDPKSGVSVGNAAITIANGAINDDKVSVANKLTAANAFYASLDTNSEIVGYSGDAANAVVKAWMTGITTQATLDAAITPAALLAVSTAATAAHDGNLLVNVSLTAGVDNKVGSAGNDSFNAVIDNTTAGAVTTIAADQTLTVLDTIDGGAGNDVLNIIDLAGASKMPAGITLISVESVNLTSAGAAGATGAGNSFDTSGFAGVTAVNVLKSAGADFITAGATQAVTVNDTAGKVTLAGGSSQTVNTVGGFALSGSAGAIVVNDTAAAAGSTIDDGSSVKVALTAKVSGGSVTIGSAGHKPTGAVTVTSSLAPTVSGAVTGGLITINGGTSISVTQTAVQPISTTDGAVNVATTQSAVTVNGTAITTDVTVKQSAVVSPLNTAVAVPVVNETATVVFSAIAANTTVTLAGMTFTAGGTGATAKQVAAAFANLSNAVSPDYTTGAVSGANSDTVTFTSTTGGYAAPDLVAGGTGAAPTIAIVQGAGVDAGGRGAIAEGAVTINDAAATIKTVTLGNYANSTITSDALATLNLSGKSGTLGITNTVGGALDLNLSAVTANGSSAITDASNKYTTLKVHTSTGSSTLSNFTSSSVTALTVDGANSLTLSSASGLSALKTVTVSGAAGLTMTSGVAGTVTDINASATTGNVSVALTAGATYEGGSGNDNVIVTAGPSAAISGGAGTDTLTLNFAGGYNASGNTNITGFETLGLGAAASTAYDATGFLHLTETAVANAVSFTNVAAGVDLSITGTAALGTTYTLKDATGTADSLTVAVKGAIAAGSLTAAGIESVTLSATDALSTAAGSTASSITIVDTAVKSMIVTGNTTLTLTNTGNVALTSVDASGMTGGLTYVTAGTVAETVKGGATANFLTAAAGNTADVLIGGAANDKLVANAGLDILTGGAGNDTFVIGTASANVNSYATITDAKAGDVIQFVDIALAVEAFTAAKVTLAATAVFQDYANAAINSNNVAGAISWFQFGGDTYVVENAGAAGTLNFENGTDLIVKLTGTVDLSTATFLSNGGVPTILIH